MRLFVVTTLLLFCINGNSVASLIYQVNVNTLNVRENPTKDSHIIFKLHRNDIVEVKSMGRWAEVEYKGQMGFVYADYIKSVDNSDGYSLQDIDLSLGIKIMKVYIVDLLKENSWIIVILIVLTILVIVRFYFWMFFQIRNDRPNSWILKPLWDISYLTIATIPIVIGMCLSLLFINFISICGIFSCEYWFRFVMRRDLANPNVWWDYLLVIFFWFNDLLSSIIYAGIVFIIPLYFFGKFTVSGYFLSYIFKTCVIFIFCCAIYDNWGVWFIDTFGNNSILELLFKYCYFNDFMPSMCPVVFGIAAIIATLLPSFGLKDCD